MEQDPAYLLSKELMGADELATRRRSSSFACLAVLLRNEPRDALSMFSLRMERSGVDSQIAGGARIWGTFKHLPPSMKAPGGAPRSPLSIPNDYAKGTRLGQKWTRPWQ